jgi:hypothetical protein
MRNADVPEDGTNERRGFFSRGRETRRATPAKEETTNTPSVEEAVDTSLASSTPINSASTGYAYFSTSTGTYTYTSGSGSTTGITYYPTYVGTTTTGSTSPITSTPSGTPIFDTMSSDKLNKMKKDYEEQIAAMEEERADLEELLRLTKTQLRYQIDENDELIEKQSEYDKAIARLDRGYATNRNVIDLFNDGLKRITAKWDAKVAE